MSYQDLEKLYSFQKTYLFKVIENIPDSLSYAKQDEGLNSAGWIMGHLCAEGEDVLKKLNVTYSIKTDYHTLFSYNAESKLDPEKLPSLETSKKDFETLYSLLIEKYKTLTDQERQSTSPSELLGKHLPELSTWFAHHLTTHLAVHIGNITVWKKLLGLKVNGY